MPGNEACRSSSAIICPRDQTLACGLPLARHSRAPTASANPPPGCRLPPSQQLTGVESTYWTETRDHGTGKTWNTPLLPLVRLLAYRRAGSLLHRLLRTPATRLNDTPAQPSCPPPHIPFPCYILTAHPSGSHHYSTTETHGGTMQMLNVQVQLPGGNRRIPPG